MLRAHSVFCQGRLRRRSRQGRHELAGDRLDGTPTDRSMLRGSIEEANAEIQRPLHSTDRDIATDSPIHVVRRRHKRAAARLASDTEGGNFAAVADSRQRFTPRSIPDIFAERQSTSWV